MLIIFRPIYTSDTLLLEDNQFPDIYMFDMSHPKVLYHNQDTVV